MKKLNEVASCSENKLNLEFENILYVSEYGHVCKLVSYLWLFSKYAMKIKDVKKYLESGQLVERHGRAFYLYKTNKRESNLV